MARTPQQQLGPRRETFVVPGGPVYRWTIFTGGPIPHFTGTAAEARAYVERYAPLKRGWTGRWEQYEEYPHRHYYTRINSRGNVVKGYGILLTRARGEMGRVGPRPERCSACGSTASHHLDYVKETGRCVV